MVCGQGILWYTLWYAAKVYYGIRSRYIMVYGQGILWYTLWYMAKVHYGISNLPNQFFPGIPSLLFLTRPDLGRMEAAPRPTFSYPDFKFA